jgi:hypothetical protein
MVSQNKSFRPHSFKSPTHAVELTTSLNPFPVLHALYGLNNNTIKVIYNPNAKRLVISTTRPLVLKYRPCPSVKNSSLLRDRLNAATRIIKNPNTVYNTKKSVPLSVSVVAFQLKAAAGKRERARAREVRKGWCKGGKGATTDCVELLLEDFQNDEGEGELSETCSPVRCFKCPLTGSTINS